MSNDDRRRRVPPRHQNPEAAPAPLPVVHQLAQIPWLTVIVTSGVTTLTGYAILELVRAAHRSIQRRREAKRDEIMASNPPKPVTPPGVKPGGVFQLPEPGPSLETAASVMPYAGFAAPAANMPYPPQQAHPQQAFAVAMQAMAHNFEDRMARLEEMVAASRRGTG